MQVLVMQAPARRARISVNDSTGAAVVKPEGEMTFDIVLQWKALQLGVTSLLAGTEQPHLGSAGGRRLGGSSLCSRSYRGGGLATAADWGKREPRG